MLCCQHPVLWVIQPSILVDSTFSLLFLHSGFPQNQLPPWLSIRNPQSIVTSPLFFIVNVTGYHGCLSCHFTNNEHNQWLQHRFYWNKKKLLRYFVRLMKMISWKLSLRRDRYSELSWISEKINLNRIPNEQLSKDNNVLNCVGRQIHVGLEQFQ